MQADILYITPYIPFPNNKAANLFISRRIKLLSERFNIDLLSVTNGRYDTDIKTYDLSRYVSSFDYVVRHGVNIKALLTSLIKNESLFATLSEGLIAQIDKKLQRKNYEFVIIEHSYLASFVIKSLPQIESKVVCVFHNIETDYFLDLMRKTKVTNPKKLFYYIEYNACRKLEDNLYRSNSKAFWFLSRTDMKFVQKHSKNKNLLLNPTIHFSLKNHRSSRQKVYDLLYMGQLDNERNLHGLAWFIENVWKNLQILNLSFAIVGRGSLKKLRSIVKKQRNIHLIGEVDCLEEIFSKSRVTVIPIFNTIGVQTKLFDSLVQGNVVICTEDAIRGTNFEPNKHLLVAKNAKDFEKKIVDVLNNHAKYENFIENLKILEKEFETEKLLNDMLGSLNEK